jgi:DNA-binding response OmpR family regulator
MAKILLVEDDKDMTVVIRTWLTSDSHTVEVVHSGTDGMDRLRICSYDIVLLDWELPEKSGLELLQAFRGEGGTTPVILLTGRRSIDDKEAGLDCGADDYLTKPFHMKELSARIRSVLRRAIQNPSNVLKEGDLSLDPSKHKVFKNGNEIALLPKEFALLEFLMRHPGDVFSGEALLQRVWHSDSEATIEAVRTCVKRLRQKLDEDKDDSIIETVSRVGYRLNAR